MRGVRGLQAKQGDWLPWLTGLPQADLVDLLALCGVLTVNALPSTGLSGNAGAIAAAAGLDMADWWKAAAEGYLNHLLMARIVQALKGAGPGLGNSGSDALKKGDLVAAAAKRLAGTRWLPKPPRADQTRAVSGLRVEPAAFR